MRTMAGMPENTAADRRSSPRIEILAQAEIMGTDIRIMEVRNISLGGIFLVGTPDQYPDLVPGVDIDLAISATDEDMGDEPDDNIACHARIVRIDAGDPGNRPPGFGATLEPIDEENRERLTLLLLRTA